jgi:hypothetical protein
MDERQIRIPRILHELHGEKADLLELALVYAIGAAFGVLALIFAWSRVNDLAWWKALLLFLVAADVSGGVVANFTPGTDRYYAARPRLRWVFIFIHIIEPAILFLLFDGRLAYWCFLYIFTVAGASLVNIIPDRARQEPVAAAVLVIGTVIVLPIGLATPFLAWFGPVYMLKLILAFAVRRSAGD